MSYQRGSVEPVTDFLFCPNTVGEREISIEHKSDILWYNVNIVILQPQSFKINNIVLHKYHVFFPKAYTADSRHGN